jgi:hypothetical protein
VSRYIGVQYIVVLCIDKQAKTLSYRAAAQPSSGNGSEGAIMCPDLIVGYREMGSYLLETDRPAEAVPYFETSLRLAGETRGEKHETYGSALWGLGRAREAPGDWEAEALDACRRGLRAVQSWKGRLTCPPEPRHAQGKVTRS